MFILTSSHRVEYTGRLMASGFINRNKDYFNSDLVTVSINFKNKDSIKSSLLAYSGFFMNCAIGESTIRQYFIKSGQK